MPTTDKYWDLARDKPSDDLNKSTILKNTNSWCTGNVGSYLRQETICASRTCDFLVCGMIITARKLMDIVEHDRKSI